MYCSKFAVSESCDRFFRTRVANSQKKKDVSPKNEAFLLSFLPCMDKSFAYVNRSLVCFFPFNLPVIKICQFVLKIVEAIVVFGKVHEKNIKFSLAHHQIFKNSIYNCAFLHLRV